MSAHQGRLLEEAGRREEDEAVDVVRPALPPALHRIHKQRGAAQGVRDHAQAVRLRHARQVVHLVPLPVLPPAPPARAETHPPQWGFQARQAPASPQTTRELQRWTRPQVTTPLTGHTEQCRIQP